MLKAQDCLILIKLIADPKKTWSQRQLAKTLFISLAETNAGIKRLMNAGLLRHGDKQPHLIPNLNAAEEFLIHSIKYLFPGKLGEFTRGIPTGIAAPLFKNKIAAGNDPLLVWPDALGDVKGVSLLPIHASVGKSIRYNPDNNFYEILVLLDIIRMGRARERNMAIQLLKKKVSCSEQ